MLKHVKQLLKEKLLDLNLIKHEATTLSSGKVSPYYIDIRTALMNPACLCEVASIMADEILEVRRVEEVVYFGGPETSAISITGAIGYLFGAGCFTRVNGFYVRKATKTHGTGRLIEGFYRRGASCVIIDDVLTSGSSVLHAIKAVEAEEMKVEKVIVVVDREEERVEEFKPYESKLLSIFKASELLEERLHEKKTGLL